MKKGFLVLFFLLLSSSIAKADNFYTCKSTYALCTTAKCTKSPNNKTIASCACDVVTGYSAATTACQPIKQTNQGKLIYSRYYPIKSYKLCTNNRPWAWCLDKPCIIDKKNPAKAVCACSIVDNMRPYVIVTDNKTDNQCTSGIISSATVAQVTAITDFLKGEEQPKPYDIKVQEE